MCFFLSACALTRPEKKDIEPSGKPTPKEEKIKLGLFISGAGANTFSALPFLELFQKQNIPFDFIAGTGWGAWLAGLYAKNQTVDNIKWNLFKLKEQKVFEKHWFRKKRKNTKLLKSITKKALFSPLSIPFVCPAVNSAGQIFWFKEKKPGISVLRCLNNIPPLYFSFENKKEYGSLFSAELTLKYAQKKGINTLIWIKPSIQLKNDLDKTPSLFWRELIAYLNNMQKRYTPKKANHLSYRKKENTQNQNNVIILETKASSFSVSDFSHLHIIMKTPVLLREKQKIINLKNRLQKLNHKKKLHSPKSQRQGGIKKIKSKVFRTLETNPLLKNINQKGLEAYEHKIPFC